MVELPKEVFDLLNSDKATKVVASKTPEGDVHAIIVGSVSAPDPRTIVFGTLVMKRSSQNLRVMMEKGELAAVLVALGVNSYEVRCRIVKQAKAGPQLKAMNEKLAPMGLKMTSVWYLEPLEVWDQSASYNAGTRLV
ncbi:MAG: hypothetical protein MUE65_00300 [Methanomassiliicoccales archaeon]|jgi:hypothetical protein|nr:hypothetical protein [Methanomassiliicoccales archaeon]